MYSTVETKLDSKARIRWALNVLVTVEYVTWEYGAAKCNLEITSGVAII